MENTSNMLPLYLTVDELASTLRIGRNAAYNLVHEGKIYFLRIGRTIRIPRDALVELIEETESL